MWRILAARPPHQELCKLRIGRHESVSLLAVVAAVHADGDRVAILAEHPPYAAGVLPAVQQRDVIRARLHGSCIRRTRRTVLSQWRVTISARVRRPYSISRMPRVR